MSSHAELLSTKSQNIKVYTLTSIKVQCWILPESERLNRSLFAQPVLNCVSKSRRPITFESRQRQLRSAHLSPLTCSSPPARLAAAERRCSPPTRRGDAGVGSRVSLAAPPPKTATWSRKGKNTRGLLRLTRVDCCCLRHRLARKHRLCARMCDRAVSIVVGTRRAGKQFDLCR